MAISSDSPRDDTRFRIQSGIREKESLGLLCPLVDDNPLATAPEIFSGSEISCVKVEGDSRPVKNCIKSQYRIASSQVSN